MIWITIMNILCPFWKEVKVETLWASWCDSMAVAPPVGEVSCSWHTSVSTRGQPASRFLTARSCVSTINVTRNSFGTFSVNVDDKAVFRACRWQAAARDSSNSRVSVTKDHPHYNCHELDDRMVQQHIVVTFTELENSSHKKKYLILFSSPRSRKFKVTFE